jgi:hypothetical protein
VVFDIDVASAVEKTRDFGPARTKFPEFEFESEFLVRRPWAICEGRRKIIVKPLPALTWCAVLHMRRHNRPIVFAVGFNKLAQKKIFTFGELVPHCIVP